MTSLNEMNILLRFFSVRCEKLGSGWPFISKFEFEGKNFSLSDEYDMTLRLFIIVGTPALPRNASGLLKFTRSSLFLSYLGLDSSCVATLSAFYNYLTATAGIFLK